MSVLGFLVVRVTSVGLISLVQACRWGTADAELKIPAYESAELPEVLIPL